MNRRSLFARAALGLCLTLVTALGVTGCHTPLYYYTDNQFAGRAIPPSGLQQRVLATYTVTGSSGGGAAILDGLRDLRGNIQNTRPNFSVAGYSPGLPTQIINFPEQQTGYILDQTTGTVTSLNYATERSGNALLTLGANAPAAAVAPDGSRAVGATTTVGASAGTTGTGTTGSGTGTTGTGTTGTGSGTSPGSGSSQVQLVASTGTYALNLPNVYRVVMNPGNSVILAMTRNSNAVFRVVQLPQTSNPQPVPGAVDCQPLLLPVYCIVPVKGTFDRPTGAYFSLDGSTAYVLNCGPECGGTQASVSALSVAQITYNNYPTQDPLAASAPSAMAQLPVANPVPIPGGVTAAISDGTNLYVSGQSQFRLTGSGPLTSTPAADGLFTGFLTTVPLSTYVPSNPVSISDGTHTRMLFADNNTLWVGSNNCAVGERARTGANINCLTMVTLGGTSPTAMVIPNVTPGGSTQVSYPNTNGNLYYYGDLTGICWVQNYNKVYTAYGGQIHVFYTGGPITDRSDPAKGTTPAAGTEANNANVTVQGTVLDVAYMDALTNQAN